MHKFFIVLLYIGIFILIICLCIASGFGEPPIAVNIITPRALFGAFERKAPLMAATSLDFFLVAVQKDIDYKLLWVEFETHTKAKNPESLTPRRFWIKAGIVNEDQILVGESEAKVYNIGKPFKIKIDPPQKLPLVRLKEDKLEIVGIPLMLNLYFNAKPEDFYTDDFFMLDGINAGFISKGKQYETETHIFQSAKLLIHGTMREADIRGNKIDLILYNDNPLSYTPKFSKIKAILKVSGGRVRSFDGNPEFNATYSLSFDKDGNVVLEAKGKGDGPTLKSGYIGSFNLDEEIVLKDIELVSIIINDNPELNADNHWKAEYVLSKHSIDFDPPLSVILNRYSLKTSWGSVKGAYK